MELFLVRHGITEWNKNRRYCGITDVNLSDEGRKQITVLRESNVIADADVLFTSSMKRSVQTAEILFPQKELIKSDEITEIDFGQWEGLTYEEVKTNFGSFYDEWLKSPYKVTIPSGESLLDFEKRTMGFIKHVIKEHFNKTVVCVTHGGVIKILERYLLDKPQCDIWGIPTSNAGVSWFKIEGTKVIDYKLNNKTRLDKQV